MASSTGGATGKPKHSVKRSKADPAGIAAKFAKLGLSRPEDFALHLPARYEDETVLVPLSGLPPFGLVQTEGQVREVSIQFRPRRQLVVFLSDPEGGELVLRFLNFYGSQTRQFEQARENGSLIRVFGELRGGFFGAEMVHPRYRALAPGTPLPAALTPVYPTTAGVSQARLRKEIGRALASVELAETVPLPASENLPSLAQAVATLHAPPVGSAIAALNGGEHPCWTRVRFDELVAQQLSLRRAYRARRTRGARALVGTGELSRRLLAALPFRMTSAQQRVGAEISADLAQSYPMQRLLQGDVGSGKTLVAALAALTAIEAGAQAAFMAPTEILAEQHALKLVAWLQPLGLSVVHLTGNMRGAEKRARQAAVAGGAQLVVGTHALIQDAVDFAKLGLAIVDEQHRFGVAQRLALRRKGEDSGFVPHQLMMSATPIPRTLAMSFFADLDVSVIDELPPGRKPVRTRLVADARRDEVVERIRVACSEGRQAYWVCPLVEESDKIDLQAAIDTWNRLREELPEISVGLVHGRLKGEEKAATMAAFAAGAIQLLVATTVIEVGVDVPNASLMVIEHAERFGLSQLHQLRGRVGRGAAESSCVLMYAGPLSETARERLKVIYENSDGFEIARRDLALRGPGEFIGVRQSGVPMLRYADLERDADWLPLARDTAERMLAESPEAVRIHLDRWFGSREEFLKA